MPSAPAIVIDMKVLAAAIESMGISPSVNVPFLYDSLAKEALKNPPQPPPLDATKRQKLLTKPGIPPPKYTSTTGQVELSPEDKAKKARVVERAQSDFKDKPPVIYLEPVCNGTG